MPYRHFKMEGMKDVIDLLNQGDYMIKIDLNDAYWYIPIHPSIQKYLRFQWKEKLYEMLAFGVGPGPKIFTKLLKVPLTILRRLMIVILAYLDDLLIKKDNRRIHKSLLTPKFWFNNKLGKVCSPTNPRGGVLGCDYKQCQD